MGTDASPPTEGMCACGAALPTFVLMHGGKRCDKCRNAPDATGAMDTIIQKLRRSTQPGLAPLYGFTPAEAELMLARLAPEPSARYRFPRQPKLEDGWTIEYAYLDKVLQECRKGVDNWVSYPEQVESVLMALERLSATKRDGA